MGPPFRHSEDDEELTKVCHSSCECYYAILGELDNHILHNGVRCLPRPTRLGDDP